MVFGKCARENAIQSSTALIMHDNYAAAKQWTWMPVETILWNMLFGKIKVEDKMTKFMRSALMRSLTKIERELQIIQKKKHEYGRSNSTRIKAKFNPSESSLFEIVDFYKEKMPSMESGFVLATFISTEKF
ncbi:Protein CBG11820 [Caenorhabditis briggsae]|uniref:Protein CBG11820 n=1 Tax=Caenorhabditis briggsae TaxID=6238 RepID=A8XE38_CAEBR|nr:Protein CBG11820 [Caenorhabditis briggsae]CAP30910.2 Protein CBG11820 [Caenorhabditis briggsae]